jgi:enoyl-CoA hydratase/carnithine racemase
MAALDSGTTAAPAPEPGEAPLVHYEMRGKVAVLTLNRPDRRNAWSFALEKELFDLADRADEDPQVGALVLTGSGTSFCPGMDMSVLITLGQSAGVAARPRPATHLRTMRKLTVCAINGGCAGVGLVQALCCDVRFAADEARISCSFTRRGAPAEYGASWLLPRLIGLADATDLLLSGRTIGAAEAERLRLVTRTAPRAKLLDLAIEYAQDVAVNCAPLAVQAVKAQLAGDATRELADSVQTARGLAHEPARRPDLAEGAQAFLEKRSPRFAPLRDRADQLPQQPSEAPR